MPPDTTTSTVAGHEVMSWSRTYVDHGVPAGFAVLLVVLALALGLALGFLARRRQPAA